MRGADAVVVTAVPIGHGNARNIEAVRDALGAGAPVWVAEGLADNDFTGVVAGLSGGRLREYRDEVSLVRELEDAEDAAAHA